MSSAAWAVVVTVVAALITAFAAMHGKRQDARVAKAQRDQERAERELERVLAREAEVAAQREEKRRTANQVRLTSGLWLRELDETRQILVRSAPVDPDRFREETRAHREAVYKAIVEAAEYGLLPSGGYWDLSGAYAHYVADGVPMLEAMGSASAMLGILTRNSPEELAGDEAQATLAQVEGLLDEARRNRQHGLNTLYRYADPE
ncbi:hypothetical protein [Streptomyces sp. SAJ15]|uniref:hypothetical protein n=1 Tax=Streptomyces sp. SAJ15 TaxID=2011095 RepID=UPI00118526B1|nr:hypothetical protein [Streptomyces sp. SAJ15]